MSEPDLSREFLDYRTDIFEQGKRQGKKEMLEWLEKEFAKHGGLIVNAFKKEIMRKAKKQAEK